MREMIADVPVPEFDETAFTIPPPLREATVALVTTAGLIRPGEDLWFEGDPGFRVLTRDDQHLIVAHQSTNFDRTGIAADLNVAYPLDRLIEMEREGTIGHAAFHHLSFTGPIVELSTVILD